MAPAFSVQRRPRRGILEVSFINCEGRHPYSTKAVMASQPTIQRGLAGCGPMPNYGPACETNLVLKYGSIASGHVQIRIGNPASRRRVPRGSVRSWPLIDFMPGGTAAAMTRVIAARRRLLAIGPIVVPAASRSPAVTFFHRSGTADERSDATAINHVVRQKTWRRGAVLILVVELTGGRVVAGPIKLSVVKRDRRGIPSELHRTDAGDDSGARTQQFSRRAHRCRTLVSPDLAPDRNASSAAVRARSRSGFSACATAPAASPAAGLAALSVGLVAARASIRSTNRGHSGTCRSSVPPAGARCCAHGAGRNISHECWMALA